MIRLLLAIILSIYWHSAYAILDASLSDLTITKAEISEGKSLNISGTFEPSSSIIIAIFGPKKNYKIDYKTNLFGFWISKNPIYKKDVISFYKIFSLYPLEAAAQFKLLEDMQLDPELFINNAEKSYQQKDLLNHLVKEGLYDPNIESIEIIGNNFFRKYMPLSNNMPTGRYIVNVMSFDASLAISNKTSLSFVVTSENDFQFLIDFKSANPNLYSLICIALPIIIAILSFYVGITYNFIKSKFSKMIIHKQ